MPDKAWLGIDLGTSGCRVIAINSAGQVIARQSTDYPAPRSAATRHSPNQQWSLVKQCLQSLLNNLRDYRIEAIAVDATSGSVMLADADYQPLTDMLMYHDGSAIKEAQTLSTIAPAESAAHGTGSGLAKTLFLLGQLSSTHTVRLLHESDWINSQLGVQRHITDYHTALKTGYDPVNLCWPAWLKTIIPSSVLPEVVAPGTEIGQLDDQLTAAFDLPFAPKIIAGTTDSIAGLIATGASQTGDAVTVLGSTLVLKIISDQPVSVPALGIYSHRFADRWLVGGASNCGGAILRQFFDDKTLEQLSQQINLDAPTPDYYPLPCRGERFPINDPDKLPLLTPRPASDVLFLHGLLKSLSAIEAEGYRCLQQYGAAPLKTLRSIGGGSRNPTWQALRARIMDCQFLAATQTDAAYGAAQLARRGLNDQ